MSKINFHKLAQKVANNQWFWRLFYANQHNAQLPVISLIGICIGTMRASGLPIMNLEGRNKGNVGNSN